MWAIETLTGLAAQVVAHTGIEDWILHKELLRERFVPKNQSIYLREKLFAMKQSGDLNAYLLKFQEVLAELDPTPTEDDKLVYFINGLREKTREAVLYETPTTLDQAIQVALAYEQAHFAHNQSNRSSAPMDIDLAPGTSADNSSFQPHFQSRSPFNSRGSGRFRQGYGRGRGAPGRGNSRFRRPRSPAGRWNGLHDVRRSQNDPRSRSNSHSRGNPGPCYQCNRYGHIARNCPNRYSNRSRPFSRVTFMESERLNGQAARPGQP